MEVEKNADPYPCSQWYRSVGINTYDVEVKADLVHCILLINKFYIINQEISIDNKLCCDKF